MANFSKAIGIVGGAGPMASAFLYRAILDVCQKQYQANDYNEFPEIILVSYPFTRGDKEQIKKEISLCFSKLEKAGANLFCIASNSFHGFLPDISHIAFVHLINEGLKEAIDLKISHALILAAQSTIDLKLYERGHIKCFYPSKKDQQTINSIIRQVAQGSICEEQALELKTIIANYHREVSINGVILACTELPLIHKNFPLSIAEKQLSLPIVDTVEVLAMRLVSLSIFKN